MAVAQNLYFMGLEKDTWRLYKIAYKPNKSSQLSVEVIPGFDNVRDFSIGPTQKVAVSVSPAGGLTFHDLGSQTSNPFVLGAPEDRFTQLSFSSDDTLWAVHLPAGNSRHTQLIKVSVSSGSYSIAVARRGSQFDPFFSEPHLYFTAALCVDDCDPMIWELWRRNTISAHMEQLTLSGAVARAPVVSGDGLYFISNKAGNYHIWRTTAKPGADMVQLTRGQVTDSDPQPSLGGGVFFIRKVLGSTALYHLSVNGRLQQLSLPKSIIDIRALEVIL